MTDTEFLQAVRAALARPDAVEPAYGLSVTVVGLRGAGSGEQQELVIDFSLPDMPNGECRQPYDAEWRRQFLPDDPSVYASELADEVHNWATEHVEKFRPELLPPARDPKESWFRLLEFLNDWTAAREVAPGRIEVRVEDRLLTIVMTPDELDEMVGMIYGEVEHALPDVRRWIMSARPEDRFVLYENYELHLSPTEETPGERWQAEFEAKLAETRDLNPGAKFGWYAERRDGTRDWFADHED